MRAALICSNPDCRKQTVAPSESDEDKFVCIGKAAHITAAARGGPRYAIDMSPAERSAISNAIYLCSGCADLIDKNNRAAADMAGFFSGCHDFLDFLDAG